MRRAHSIPSPWRRDWQPAPAWEPAAVVAHEVGVFDAAALVEQRGVETVEGTLRMPVHLADAKGVVALPAQHPWHLVAVVLGHDAVAQHAVVPGREPREQRGTSRRTTRTGRVGVVEAVAVGRQRIEVGREDGGVAGAAHRVGALLVGHEQDDMRRPLCGSLQTRGQAQGAGGQSKERSRHSQWLSCCWIRCVGRVARTQRSAPMWRAKKRSMAR